MKIPDFDSWNSLNEVIMKADEVTVEAMLKKAKKDGRPLAYLKRMHSRLNKLRADRERLELGAVK